MRTLVVYATKHGTAKKCAEILKEKASGTVDIADAKDRPDISGYDKVILGASVYIGKIRKHMVSFCRRNREVLLEKRIGLYICSGDHSEKGLEYLKMFGDDLYAHATASELFGHQFNWESMNFLERFIMSKTSGEKGSSSHLVMENIDRFMEKMGLSD